MYKLQLLQPWHCKSATSDRTRTTLFIRTPSTRPVWPLHRIQSAGKQPVPCQISLCGFRTKGGTPQDLWNKARKVGPTLMPWRLP